jgi:hypothetical protein
MRKVDRLPPLFSGKRFGTLVLERAERVNSSLKNYAKAYTRSFWMQSGEGREI